MRRAVAAVIGVFFGLLACSSGTSSTPTGQAPAAGTPCGELLACCVGGSLDEALSLSCIQTAYAGGEQCAQVYDVYGCDVSAGHAETEDNDDDSDATTRDEDGASSDDGDAGDDDSNSSADDGGDDDSGDRNGDDDSSGGGGDDVSGGNDGSGSVDENACATLDGCCAADGDDLQAQQACNSIAATGDPIMCEPAEARPNHISAARRKGEGYVTPWHGQTQPVRPSSLYARPRWIKGIWAPTRALCSLRTPSLAAETGLARPTPSR